MHHPLLGNLRRELVVAATLVAVGTAALTAAHWSASPPGAPPELLGYDSSIAMTGESKDIQLGRTPAPLFAEAKTPAAFHFSTGGDDVVLPVVIAAHSGLTAQPREWGGFTSSDQTATRSPRRSSSGGSTAFAGSIGGMSMGGAWGGVSGTAAPTPKANPAASIVQKTTGAGAPSLTRKTAAQTHGSGEAAAVEHAAASDHASPVAVAQVALNAQPHASADPVFHPDPADPPVGGEAHPSPGGPAAVPEPTTLMLVGLAAFGLYGLRRHLR